MAKNYTPEMEKLKKRKRTSATSPWKEAWKRLKRNRSAILGMTIIGILILVAIFADLIAPFDYHMQDYTAVGQSPNSIHYFGTDNMGRDIFSRCVYGVRWSLPIGVLCVIAGLALGGTLGVLAGFFGGRVDNLIMRAMDIFQGIPATLMSIAIVAVLGNGLLQLIIGISVAFMPSTAKICRAAIFTVKKSDYIEASRSLGVRTPKIILRHMLPNAAGTIIIFAVNMISSSILIVSTLSYIGIGILPPTPEWGSILSAGKEFIGTAPHMVLFPGIMIMITVIAFNLFGDGLRDALDPRLK